MIVNGKRRTGRLPLRDAGRDRFPVLVPDQTQEVASTVLGRFPEFAQSPYMEGMEGLEVEGPYVVLGGFALYLMNGLEERTLSLEEVERAFEFLNEVGEIPDSDVQNMLAVGALEILTDYEWSVEAARTHLRGRALESFEEMYRFWKPHLAQSGRDD